MPQDERIRHLQKVDILADCSKKQLKAVAAISKVVVVPSGTMLTRVGEPGGMTTAMWRPPPGEPSDGLIDGLVQLAEALGLDLGALLEQTERIVHGTTVATNALLERKGARVGLLTTEGHRDVIEMREGLKDDRYNLRLPPPEQLVSRKLRLGVRERLRADGRVETPLDPASLDRAIAVLQGEGVEAVAACDL